MTFDERYKTAVRYLQKYRNLSNFEDIEQSVALELWKSGSNDIKQVCDTVARKLNAEELKHNRLRAKSLYNDDGDCIDDDIYFVDPKTVEKFGETNFFTDDIRDKVAGLEKILQFVDAFFWGKRKGRIIVKSIYDTSQLIQLCVPYHRYKGCLIEKEKRRWRTRWKPTK